MKKIVSSIILLLLSFSSVNANSLSIEETLNIDYGLEIYKLSNINIEEFDFANAGLKGVHSRLVRIDGVLKEQIISSFKEGKLEYNEVSYLIDEYENFVFYVNELFFYIDLIDKGYDTPETRETIEDLYIEVIASFKKMKSLVNK